MKMVKGKLWDGYKKEERILIANVLDQYTRYLNTGTSQNTNFLNPYELLLVTRVLEERHIVYQVVFPIDECEQRVLMFGEGLSPITIYRGIVQTPITHSDILGTLFSIGYDRGLIGDIFIEDDCFYLTNLVRMNSFLEEHFYQVRNQLVTLERVDTIILKREHYTRFTLIVSSLRLDHLVSLLSKRGRTDSLKILKKGEVLLNYHEIIKGTIQLKEGDILSIRRVGKFRFVKVLNQTKKQKKVIEIWKYQ